jgi:hypothetical protein
MTGVSRRISATVTLRTRRPSVQAGCALEPWAGGGVCAVGVLTVPAGAAWATPTWLAPVDLSAPGQNAGRPQVAVDHAGDAVAVWNRFSGGKEIVQAATRPAGGTSRQHGARRTPEKRSEQLLNNVPRHEPVSVAAFRRIVASVFGPECAYGGLALASVNVVLEAEQ